MSDDIDTKLAASIPVATDEIAGKHYQRIKIADGAADSTAMIGGDAANGLDVDVTRLPALVAGTANIGDVDVLTVPADPFGVNADASSATGSISAKLKFLAAGIAGATSLPAGANNIGDVDVLTVPADPFGANADASSATGSISAKLKYLAAGIAGATSLPAGANNIGDVDVVTVPTDPFGANADAASATGSISAKLRYIAATGIPISAIVPGVAATSLGKAEDAAHTSGDVGVMMLGVRNSAHAARTDSDGDYGAIAIDAEGCQLMVGNVAHDAVDSDPPVKIGAVATASLSGATMVAAADRTNLFAGTDGVLITRPYCNLEDIVTGRISNTDGAATDIIAAQAAGVKMYLTSVVLVNTSATNVYADILDDATIKVTLPLPAYGGAVFNPPVPIPGTAAKAWRLDVSAATTTVYATAIAFKSKI